MRRGRLGDVLVDERLIGRDQLHQAERAAEHLGSPLIAVLVDQGLVDENAMVDALSHSLRMEVFDPARSRVDMDALREVPYEEADRYWLMPVHVLQHGTQKVLKVAMADPLDTQAIENIEFSTGTIVEPLIAHPTRLMEVIRGNYRGMVTKIIPRSAPVPVSHQKDDSAASGSSRPVFGGNLDDASLRTRPICRVQQMVTEEQKIDALVSILIRKEVITLDEYEDQLEALVGQLKEKP